MPNFLDALAASRAHNKQLFSALLVTALVGAVGMTLLWARPRQIDLHINPDLRAGDQVSVANGVAPVPNPNVYSFAYYVWQQVNRWQADGTKDYGQQIFNFQSYLTPRCQAQLQGDINNRNRTGELQQRTRQISEIPGLGFQDNRVIGEGPSAWTVLLDMQVTETFRGQAVKDTFVRYPVRVVRYDVDRERNPFRLAVDCFGSASPARIDITDSAISSAQGVAPTALPSISNQAPIVVTPGAATAPPAPAATTAQAVAPVAQGAAPPAPSR
jgi:integrating conjugative element protein (TIGR03746 family)